MPLNEIPAYLSPDTRRVIDAALEDAWQELKKDGLVEAHRARMN
jgi:SspJ family small acid-soluble spore protein